MNQIKPRYIHSHLSSRQIPDLLQTIFASELICPSRTIWLVSPWISDIPILENSANQFLSLEPTMSGGRVRLVEVLIKIMSMGTKLYLVTRPDSHNSDFINSLKSNIGEGKEHLKIIQAEELHEKGLLGDDYYLAGSMNFTYNGITLNQESIHFTTDPHSVAQNKLIFSHRWGEG